MLVNAWTVGALTKIVYCLVDVFVPSDAVTVNVDVVFEVTVFAVPDQVPFELKVNPAGIDPAVTENVTVSLSSSVAVTAVKLDAALFAFSKVPKDPAATPKTGAASILKAVAKLALNPDVRETETV